MTRLFGSLIASFMAIASAAAQPNPAGQPYPGASVRPQPFPALPVDCAAVAMRAPGQQGCETSEIRWQSYLRPSQWFEDSLPAPECATEVQSARTRAGRLEGLVKLIRLKPSSDFRCSLGGRGMAPILATRSIDQTVKDGKDLTFPDWSGGKLLSAFISAQGQPCRAFIALGPQQISSRRSDDNHAYRLHGYVCAPAGGPITDIELESFIASIQVRVG